MSELEAPFDEDEIDFSPIKKFEAEYKMLVAAVEEERLAVIALTCAETQFNPFNRPIEIPLESHEAQCAAWWDVRKRIERERDSVRFKDAVRAYDENLKKVFDQWCDNPSLHSRGAERAHAISQLTYYVRRNYKEVGDIPSVADSDSASKMLPPSNDIPAVRRYCLLSCEAWWRRNHWDMNDDENYRDSPSPYDSELYSSRVSAFEGSIEKKTSLVFNFESDHFSFRRRNRRLCVVAVIEQWVEAQIDAKSDEAFLQRLDNDPHFQEILNKLQQPNSDHLRHIQLYEVMDQLDEKMLPATPSIVRYTLHKAMNWDIPKGLVPRRGVLIRSLVVSPDPTFTYWSESNQPSQWDVVQEWSYDAAWVTGDILSAAGSVAMKHRDWVSSLSPFFQRHRDGRTLASRKKGAITKDLASDCINAFDQGGYTTLESATLDVWRNSPNRKEIEASSGNNKLAIEHEFDQLLSKVRRRNKDRLNNKK